MRQVEFYLQDQHRNKKKRIELAKHIKFYKNQSLFVAYTVCLSTSKVLVKKRFIDRNVVRDLTWTECE